MKSSLYDRIWRRESGYGSHYSSIRSLYGSKEWVDDLDIVNELGGHTGCVNALSWSRSGQFLASGSDDLHLNIYSYQPDSSSAPFSLSTTVSTGHRANIFSVKFMPHSNDRTLVTCAGDHQVRVFDLEHSSNNRSADDSSAFASSARSRRFNDFFTKTRYLNEGNTNARIYRSHADRVKRIVTESSPYLFLTCSEDGEVRQWDLRQPSSAYPKPHGGQGPMAYRPGLVHDDSNTPPPLISYKRHHIDLNTISCSPSQPHYIALGGAHLHCFLHDRRMLGRDLLAEAGDPGTSSPTNGSARDDELMGQATRCVRKFAPNGQRRMSPRGCGDITACKISDANPNEMVVSWSGGHIYSFDLIRSPDAAESESAAQKTMNETSDSSRRQSSKNRKRKRKARSSNPSHASGSWPRARPRVEGNGDNQDDDDGELAFRVRYGNGESEDIPLPSLSDPLVAPPDLIEQARYSVLSDAQRLSMQIAKGLVKLRKALFSLGDAMGEDSVPFSAPDLTPYTESFSTALTEASSYLPQMDEIMRTWRYPLNPSTEVVGMQQSLRRNRESAWRFVQAAGTLARVLGGQVRSQSGDHESVMEHFRQIALAPGEYNTLDSRSQFCYDFMKAVLLWVEGGRETLLAGFKRDSAYRRNKARFPLSETADDTAIETVLLPYLQGLAGDTPVVNVDASRFEHDRSRFISPTQHDIVNAFWNTLNRRHDSDNTESENGDYHATPEPSHARNANRSVERGFWAFKVCRGILMEAGSGVNYEFVNRAFGGVRTTFEDEAENDADIERSQEDIDPNVEEEPIRDINLTRLPMPDRSAPERNSGSSGGTVGNLASSDAGSISTRRTSLSGHTLDSDYAFYDRLHQNRDDDAEDDDDEDGSEDEDDGPDDFGVTSGSSPHGSDEEFEAQEEEDRMLRGYGIRRTRREHVGLDIPCSPHTRVYRGHCNIKTVKDVNYFGLNDEYVVSGSDSGHVFIWDRKSSKLVNILEADSEVVNVVQGHPYEPTIAASGIDNTIKIFSTDRRAQEDARHGINILDPDNDANTLGSNISGVGGLRSCKRIHDSYRIMSQNDVNRQGGMDEAYITREMLSRLAVNLRRQRTEGGGVENASFVLEDNCNVM